MEDATNTVLAAKRAALISLRHQVEALAPLSGSALDSTYDELATLDDKVARPRGFHEAIAERKSAILFVLKEGEAPEKVNSLSPWPPSPEELLNALAQALTQRATDIKNAAKPEEYKKLTTKVADLKSRKALSARRADITKYIAQARRNAALRRGITTLRTQEITRQGTTLIRKNLTPELLKAFKHELLELAAVKVPISVKPSGASGETAHEMLLEGARVSAGIRMTQVLSEGEARVIAIAGFLAELGLASHANTIVLDDPVSSLDHVFTRKIAARLAQEALDRQVIIFTHNIAFLMELEDACEALAKAGRPVGITAQTLRRGSQSAGITTNGAPWHAMKIKQRVQYLDELTNKIKPLHEDNAAEYNEKAAHIYGLLREAWEACIEEELFSNVVCRYRNSVQTLRLEQVDIADSDVHQIDLYMSKASTWMAGHDKSKALHEQRPAPDEMLGDINALRQFSKAITDRRKETEKRRKAQLKAA